MAVGPKYLKYGILFRVLRLRPALPLSSNFGDGRIVLESEACDAVDVLCGRYGRVS
jgi:hypothetical protein